MMVTPVPDSRLSKRPFAVQLEFVYHWFVAMGTYAYGAYLIYHASQDPRALEHSRASLSPAWILPNVFTGVDLSDTQLASFLKNFPLLVASMGGYIAVTRLVRRSAPALVLPTHLVLNAGFLIFLHGPTVLFMLAIFLVNFAWSRMHSRVPFVVYYGVAWLFHVSLLFLNDINKGYRFAWISPSLLWLDQMGTGIMRWHVIFNMSTLRMIGFLYDVWEANQKTAETARTEQEAKHVECADCVEFKAPCYKLRTVSPRPKEEYDLVAYLAYLSYVPLYIGGPLSSYNAYRSHTDIPQKGFDFVKCARYALRTFGIYLTLIALLHVNHLCTLRNDSAAFERMTVGEKMLYGILFLAFLWLKFNMIWKTFRLIGIIEGVESPEDMNRCYANTTTVGDFWRDWHASFNQWIVRYMYVPMGGNKTKVLGIVPIFVFIAVWHDIELHLLWWAGIMCIAFIPELVVSAIFAKKFRWVREKTYYRHVSATGCALSTLSLVVANLFGYGTGMSSKKGVEGMASSLIALGCTIWFLFSTSNLGLQERATRSEGEMRRKVQLGLLKTK